MKIVVCKWKGERVIEKDIPVIQPYTGAVAKKKKVIKILEITKLMESTSKKMPYGTKMLGDHINTN